MTIFIDPARYTSARLLEAHLLDAHGIDVDHLPREDITFGHVRSFHEMAHGTGQVSFAHTHGDTPTDVDWFPVGEFDHNREQTVPTLGLPTGIYVVNETGGRPFAKGPFTEIDEAAADARHAGDDGAFDVSLMFVDGVVVTVLPVHQAPRPDPSTAPEATEPVPPTPGEELIQVVDDWIINHDLDFDPDAGVHPTFVAEMPATIRVVVDPRAESMVVDATVGWSSLATFEVTSPGLEIPQALETFLDGHLADWDAGGVHWGSMPEDDPIGYLAPDTGVGDRGYIPAADIALEGFPLPSWEPVFRLRPAVGTETRDLWLRGYQDGEGRPAPRT